MRRRSVHPTAPSSDITLNLSGGALQFSVREKGSVLLNVMTRTRYDDGLRHTVAVTVNASGTKLHAGGRVVFETAQHDFFAGVSRLTALALGRNTDSDHPGGEWFCTGTVERAAVWDRVLNESELVAQFGERVTAFSPQVVSIMIGTNDIATSGLGHETYRANLVSLVRSVRALPGSPVPVLQSPNPVDPAKWPGRVGLSQYAQVMGEVAAQRNAVFTDHYNDWLDGNGGQVPLSLLSDGLHPNERGHHRVVLKMIKDLRIFEADSPVCSLHIP